VGFHDGDVGEEGLVGLALIPVCAVEEFLFLGAVEEKVDVKLARARGARVAPALGRSRALNVAGEIPGVAEPVADMAGRRGERLLIPVPGAVLVRGGAERLAEQTGPVV
jgi:hypothetical protein